MRQVHNIQESYEDYHHRKRRVSTFLIAVGLLMGSAGIMVTDFKQYPEASIGFVVGGIILFVLGIMRRKSENRRSFAP